MGGEVEEDNGVAFQPLLSGIVDKQGATVARNVGCEEVAAVQVEGQLRQIKRQYNFCRRSCEEDALTSENYYQDRFDSKEHELGAAADSKEKHNESADIN